jgi:hypothetical protein
MEYENSLRPDNTQDLVNKPIFLNEPEDSPIECGELFSRDDIQYYSALGASICNTMDYTEVERLEREQRCLIEERRRKASTSNFEEEESSQLEESREIIPNDYSGEDEFHPLKQSQRKVSTIKTENFRYIGEVLNNQRDGFGICYYTKGDVYIGQWRNDRKEGWGKTTLTNGDVNIGEVRDNLYDGFVEVKNKKKAIWIRGHVSRGKFNDGPIIYSQENREIECVGLFNNSNLSTEQLSSTIIQQQLVCKITYSNKHYFLGEIDTMNFKNGFGISVFKNNFVFQGEIQNLQSNGYGEIIQNDGTRFYGFFENNKKHGFGISFFSEGGASYGIYIMDDRHGPFFNINKSGTTYSMRMEIFHLGFKSKQVEKIDTTKKYLQLNYPEYTTILNIDYKNIYDKLVDLNKDTYYVELLKEISCVNKTDGSNIEENKKASSK